MNKKFLALPLVAAVSLLAFTGCTAPAATPAPAASPTAAPSEAPQIDVPTAEAECVDGVAVVTDDSTDVTIDGDCDNVEINASNSQITVGAVKTLKVNGSINRVVVDEVEKVVFTASGNIVVTDSDPKVSDKGEQNEVTSESE